MMKQWMWIVLLSLYAAVIGYVSHQPLTGVELPFIHFDKLMHLAEFGLLMLLAWHATGRRLAMACLLTLAFGCSDEWHQALVPGRDASGLDLIADGVGASLMAGLIRSRDLLWRFFRTRILNR
jgi:VanZ family protein